MFLKIDNPETRMKVIGGGWENPSHIIRGRGRKKRTEWTGAGEGDVRG